MIKSHFIDILSVTFFFDLSKNINTLIFNVLTMSFRLNSYNLFNKKVLLANGRVVV